jgi:aminocarboxymuconate-semialdehyde decarboxylase
MCTDGCRSLHLLCTRAFGLHEVDHALRVQAPVRTARPSMSASSPDAAPVIDVHAHLVPERAFERVPAGMRAERVEGPDEIRLVVHGPRGAGRGAPPELRDLELHRRRQERRGIGLSLLGPWVDMVKAPDEARLQQAWCRVLNEELAAATGPTDHSRWLAALPDLDGARAGQELEWAAAAGAVGGMLAANPEHGTLARGDLEWLWRAAERLRLPLVLHPGDFEPPPRLAEHFMVNLVGNPFETTLAAGSLLAAGVPERHPDLEVVLVHGGGFLPYQYARMAAGFERWPRLRELQRRSPAGLLRWFHYDTVLFADPPTRYLLELVGDDRVMAGSDCPFTMTDTRPFEAPERLGLDQAGRDRVLGGNAARLFRLHEPAGAER